MKKVLLTLFLSLMFCKIGFAESYYFKECKLSENASGDYLIDFDKNVIKLTLKTSQSKQAQTMNESAVVFNMYA